MRLAFKTRPVTLLVVLAAIAIAAACGGDAEPEPTPTPTQVVPTATPTATPEPTATPTPVPDAAAGSLMDLIITPETTGKDVMARLSEAETDCIKGAFGETVYAVMLTLPLMQAGGDAATAAPLFNCLDEANVALLGAAFIDAQAGGRSEGTRRCIADLSLKHPEVIYLRLGLEWDEQQTSHPSQTHEFILAFYNCLTDEEKGDFLVRLFDSLDRASPLTGGDLIALLPESETACVRERFSAEQVTMMLGVTPLESVRIGREAADCLSPASFSRFFVAAADGVVGGLSAESAACIASYTEEHPSYLTLLASDQEDTAEMSPTEFLEIAEGGLVTFECLTDEELERTQERTGEALMQ